MQSDRRASRLGCSSPVSRRARFNLYGNGSKFAADHLQLPEPSIPNLTSTNQSIYRSSLAAGVSSGGNANEGSMADPPFATEGTKQNPNGVRPMLRVFPNQQTQSASYEQQQQQEQGARRGSLGLGRVHFTPQPNMNTQANTVLRGATQVSDPSRRPETNAEDSQTYFCHWNNSHRYRKPRPLATDAVDAAGTPTLRVDTNSSNNRVPMLHKQLGVLPTGENRPREWYQQQQQRCEEEKQGYEARHETEAAGLPSTRQHIPRASFSPRHAKRDMQWQPNRDEKPNPILGIGNNSRSDTDTRQGKGQRIQHTNTADNLFNFSLEQKGNNNNSNDRYGSSSARAPQRSTTQYSNQVSQALVWDTEY